MGNTRRRERSNLCDIVFLLFSRVHSQRLLPTGACVAIFRATLSIYQRAKIYVVPSGRVQMISVLYHPRCKCWGETRKLYVWYTALLYIYNTHIQNHEGTSNYTAQMKQTLLHGHQMNAPSNDGKITADFACRVHKTETEKES